MTLALLTIEQPESWHSKMLLHTADMLGAYIKHALHYLCSPSRLLLVCLMKNLIVWSNLFGQLTYKIWLLNIRFIPCVFIYGRHSVYNTERESFPHNTQAHLTTLFSSGKSQVWNVFRENKETWLGGLRFRFVWIYLCGWTLGSRRNQQANQNCMNNRHSTKSCLSTNQHTK